MKPAPLITAIAVTATLTLAATPSLAQFQVGQPLDPSIKATFVHLAPGVPAVLYQPKKAGTKSHLALYVMHADGDYLEFSACTELSKRGYSVLCANNSSAKDGVSNDGILDEALLESKAAISYLRKQPGINRIVLFGHSGGATIMTAYQDIAENGVKVCQDAQKIHKCPDSLADMPPADGVVMADANWGQAEMALFSIDPAVVDERTGMTVAPSLDMLNPANGYKPTGSDYSAGFIHAYLSAEGARATRLLETAQARAKLIAEGKGDYTDDEPFVVPGGFVAANRLFSQDVKLLSHSRKPWPLIHPDGSVTTEIIHSVRVPENHMVFPTGSYLRGALKTTVQNYLSSYAIRVDPDFGYDEDSIHGVEWTSTYASPPGNVEGITVPLLTLGMTGHWEGLAAETIYDHAKSADKSIGFVQGATHIYTPCHECEATPGQFGDTVKTTYDYIDAWLSKPGRFF